MSPKVLTLFFVNCFCVILCQFEILSPELQGLYGPGQTFSESDVDNFDFASPNHISSQAFSGLQSSTGFLGTAGPSGPFQAQNEIPSEQGPSGPQGPQGPSGPFGPSEPQSSVVPVNSRGPKNYGPNPGSHFGPNYGPRGPNNGPNNGPNFGPNNGPNSGRNGGPTRPNYDPNTFGPNYGGRRSPGPGGFRPYRTRLRPLYLDEEVCHGFQERLNDSRCVAHLTLCPALKTPRDLNTLRQLLCGLRFDASHQPDPTETPSGGIPQQSVQVAPQTHSPYHFEDIAKISTRSYPWLAAIFDGNRFVCSGVQIGPDSVLTAAQCLVGRVPDSFRSFPSDPAAPANIRVSLNEYDIRYQRPFERARTVPVASISIHPDYNAKSNDNDLALIRLAIQVPVPGQNSSAQSPDGQLPPGHARTPRGPNGPQPPNQEAPLINPSDRLNKAPGPNLESFGNFGHSAGHQLTSGQHLSGEQSAISSHLRSKRGALINGYLEPPPPQTVIMGWGLGLDRPSLRTLDVHVIPHVTCSKQFGWDPFQLTPNLICVDNYYGICVSDLGGPLLHLVDGHWYLIGVLTLGRHCHTPRLPLIYTAIEPYRGWISSNSIPAGPVGRGPKGMRPLGPRPQGPFGPGSQGPLGPRPEGPNGHIPGPEEPNGSEATPSPDNEPEAEAVGPEAVEKPDFPQEGVEGGGEVEEDNSTSEAGGSESPESSADGESEVEGPSTDYSSPEIL